MMPFLIALFARWGIAERLRKPLAIAALILVAALLAGAVWLWLDKREAADDKANQEIGATAQREGDLRQTIERTEQANETREQVRRDIDAGGSRELYDQCVRTARTPANCVRFLPRGETPDR